MKTLYKFQQEAVDQIVLKTGHILADECGLGKTYTAIEAIKALDWPAPWKVLVICPPSLQDQWIDVIREQCFGHPAVKLARLPLDPLQISGWVVTQYFEIQRPVLRNTVYGTMWDAVIIDEGHRIKNYKTKVAHAVCTIPRSRSLALTGTPHEKTWADVWTLLHFCNPDEFRSYWPFVKEWLEVDKDWMEHWQIGEPKDSERFANMLGHYMIRRTKEDVAPQLPEKIVSDIHVAMTDGQTDFYLQVKKARDIEVPVGDKTLIIPNALAHLTRLQQISTFPSLLGLGATSGKVEWLKEFLADHPEPAVIFTRFRDFAIWMANEFDGDLIIGGERGTAFLDGTKRLVFGTIDAMGEGLNLQRAKHAIFMDCHWSTIKMSQAIDRIHRINIKEPKNIYRLWSSHEDNLVLQALDQKWTEAELVYYFLDRAG